MFPKLTDYNDLVGTDTVDYLIGIDKASWHPEIYMMTRGGGDFWLYENRFGKCLGGYHPWIAREQQKAKGVYTFLNSLYVNKIVENSLSVPTCSQF